MECAIHYNDPKSLDVLNARISPPASDAALESKAKVCADGESEGSTKIEVSDASKGILQKNVADSKEDLYTEMRSVPVPIPKQEESDEKCTYDVIPEDYKKNIRSSEACEDTPVIPRESISTLSTSNESKRNSTLIAMDMKKKMIKRKALPELKQPVVEVKEDPTIYDVVSDAKSAGQSETVMNEYYIQSVDSSAKRSLAMLPHTYSKTKLHELGGDESRAGIAKKWALALTLCVVSVIAIILAIVVFLAFTFIEVENLKSEIARMGNRQLPNNFTILYDSEQLVLNISDLTATISALQNQTEQFRDDLALLQSSSVRLLDGLGEPGQYSTLPITGCSALTNSSSPGYYWVRNALGSSERIYCVMSRVSSCAAVPPSSPSGYYWIRASNGSAVRVYCDMTRSCGGITGGWMRVAELDMTNSSHQCPSGFKQRTDSNIRTCVNNDPTAGCSSDIVLNSLNISYARVCGRVIGYQIGGTNAFAVQENNISSYYVDGVSITHGNPRQHIWTFASARDEITTDPNTLDSKCPCILQNSGVNVGNNRPPEFVGNDYFCDTGSADGVITNRGLLGEDPLWDGAGCGSTSNCCSFNTPPWFYKQLPQPTTDNIAIRVCRNEEVRYEDVSLEIIEIYIQ